MKTIVMSVGGSLIVPNEIDLGFLRKFAALIKKYAKKYRFVLVTGGGATARKYIAQAEAAGFDEKAVSLVGIECTRVNASLLAGFFQIEHAVPESFADVKKLIQKEGVVVCGALGFVPDMTSDGDAAFLAKVVNADMFINLTNVDGLFTKDPKGAGAELIEKIAYQEFLGKMHKIKFTPGQHFVLDHKAAHAIQKHRIRTLILNGHNLNNVEQCLNGKSFVGTVIHG